MGPGHFAIGLVARPAAPKVPLLVLLVASETLDLLSFGFMAAGVERAGVSESSIAQGITVVTPGVIPWSHGLFMSLVWSALAAGLAFLVFHDRRAAAAVGLVVFSHWALDFIVHLPDLPLFLAGSPTVGLGLWGTGPGLVISGVLEVALLAGGLGVYHHDRSKRRMTSRQA